MPTFFVAKVRGTNLQVTASRKDGNITFSTFTQQITIPQAGLLVNALNDAVTFVDKGRGGGINTQWVEFDGADKLLIRHKLLFAKDDSFFVVARRVRMGWGLYTAAAVTLEEWDRGEDGEMVFIPPRPISVNSAAARQAAKSIGMVVDRCRQWLPLDEA